MSEDMTKPDRKTKRGSAIKGLESANERSLGVRRRRIHGRVDGLLFHEALRQVVITTSMRNRWNRRVGRISSSQIWDGPKRRPKSVGLAYARRRRLSVTAPAIRRRAAPPESDVIARDGITLHEQLPLDAEPPPPFTAMPPPPFPPSAPPAPPDAPVPGPRESENASGGGVASRSGCSPLR